MPPLTAADADDESKPAVGIGIVTGTLYYEMIIASNDKFNKM